MAPRGAYCAYPARSSFPTTRRSKAAMRSAAFCVTLPEASFPPSSAPPPRMLRAVTFSPRSDGRNANGGDEEQWPDFAGTAAAGCRRSGQEPAWALSAADVAADADGISEPTGVVSEFETKQVQKCHAELSLRRSSRGIGREAGIAAPNRPAPDVRVSVYERFAA